MNLNNLISNSINQYNQSSTLYRYSFEMLCCISSFLSNREATDLTSLARSFLTNNFNLDLNSATSLAGKSRLLGLQLFCTSQARAEKVLLVASEKGKADVITGLAQMRLDISPSFLGWALEAIMNNRQFGIALDLVIYRQDMPAYWGVQLLWNKFASPQLREELLRMPKYQLLHAIKYNNTSDVSNLLTSFPSISLDWLGKALIQAAKQGSREKALLILQRKGLSPEDVGYALKEAIENHQRDMALDILRAGTELHDIYKSTSLLLAAQSGEREIVTALISRISHPNGLALGAVSAASNGQLAILKDLVETGHDFGVNIMGQSLVESAENNHEEVVHYLIGLNQHNAFYLERAISAADKNANDSIAEFLREQQLP